MSDWIRNLPEGVKVTACAVAVPFVVVFCLWIVVAGVAALCEVLPWPEWVRLEGPFAQEAADA